MDDIDLDKPLAVWAVWWRDACKEDDLTPTKPPKPLLAIHVGFIVEHVKGPRGHLTIASEVFEDGNVRDVVTIPNGMVCKVERLKSVKKPKGV